MMTITRTRNSRKSTSGAVRVALLVLALTAVCTAPAAAGGGSVDHQFIAVGTTTAGDFDVGTCVVLEPGVLECDNERTGSLVGVPFWFGAWETAGTTVVDLNRSCVDFMGRQSDPFTGSSDGVIVSGGSELYVHQEYSGCGSAAAGGHSIGTFTFTGGTGVFEGASGSALHIYATETAPTGLILSIGTLTLPNA
jgi:hypothetical protein